MEKSDNDGVNQSSNGHREEYVAFRNPKRFAACPFYGETLTT